MNQNETLVAGDTLDFTVSVPDYPASAGWTLKYRLTPRFATPTQAPIVLTATTNANGVDYNVQSGPAVTVLWAAGNYAWARWVEKSGARQTLDERGNLLVEPDPSATAQGYDARTQAAKAVEDLKVALATFQATSGRVKQYTIGTRHMEFETSTEILKMLSFWQVQLAKEDAAARIAKGLGNPRHTYVRFNRNA